MSHGMVAHFNTDIPLSHFVGYGCSRAGTKEGVEHKIVFIGGNLQNALNQTFGLRC